jgi:hypothetical protein
MKILGPDLLIFGVEDVDACIKCVTDYGLTKVEGGSTGGVFEAMNGTGVMIRHASDASLAPASAPSPNLRETLCGVADKATLQAVGAELSKDREVKLLPNGAIRSFDDDGLIGFQVTVRRAIRRRTTGINVPGQPAGRGMNVIAAIDADRPKARAIACRDVHQRQGEVGKILCGATGVSHRRCIHRHWTLHAAGRHE